MLKGWFRKKGIENKNREAVETLYRRKMADAVASNIEARLKMAQATSAAEIVYDMAVEAITLLQSISDHIDDERMRYFVTRFATIREKCGRLKSETEVVQPKGDSNGERAGQ